ncbi:MAG: DUF4280 domain-containing protein [Pseudomonadota bacterium]|nr:DUF4280 domain-containing protein [Pseudomonadota bacterium]
MPNHVCMGATLMCPMGMATSKLMVLPKNKVMTDGKPAANIMDNVPFVNILPFGSCMSMGNPATAAATAAAFGVLTPTPCIPTIAGPWAPGSPMVLLAGPPSLNMSSKLICAFGGVIQILVEGQATHAIP